MGQDWIESLEDSLESNCKETLGVVSWKDDEPGSRLAAPCHHPVQAFQRYMEVLDPEAHN